MHVVLLGGGIIGVTTAWRCAQRGLMVTVVDAQSEHRPGAWRTAAGMLAPVTELHYTEASLLNLSLQSLARYPDVIAELETGTGMRTGFTANESLAIAWDGADLAALTDLHAFAATLGVQGEQLTGRGLRALEPALAPGLPGGLLVHAEKQVDPRLLYAAVTVAAERSGVRFVRATARLHLADDAGDRVAGVVLDDGDVLAADTVVLAAGAWSTSQLGLPDGAVPHVRPVRGQTLRLSLPGPSILQRTLRGSVKGTPIYIVPRGDGRYVVGASSEEAGFEVAARAGAVYELLRDAQSLVPELGEAILDEVSTGFRPGSPDNAPIIGDCGIDGLVLATGHYRNGVLLAPVTADAIAELLTTGELPAVAAPFRPGRFARSVL